MSRTFGRVAGIIGVAAVCAAPVVAQDQDTTELGRLRRQVEAITRELESMRLGGDVVAQADTSLNGFGPAASKVYKVRQGVSVGGYGEVLYENFAKSREDDAPSGARDRVDALRAIVYVGYKFNDKFLFNSELEFEHGSTEAGGSVSLEFGYLEYRISPRFGVRGGLLLAPMGFLNEMHEPPTFLGARRPETERRIIPSTWRENGVGVFGSTRTLAYRAYVMNGLDASGFSGGGLRDGRQNGAEATAEDFALVGRLDYTGALGLTLGTSAYVGNSGQNAPLTSNSAADLDARTTIWEGHAEYKAKGLDLRGLFAVANVDNVEDIQDAFPTGDAVGEQMFGWYLQGGYDVLRGHQTEHQLIPYVRFEKLNTQEELPDAFAPDLANDRNILTLGAMWKPLPNIALKADYQVIRNEAETGVNQLNVNLGYLF